MTSSKEYSFEDFQRQRKEIEDEARTKSPISELISIEEGMHGWNDQIDSVRQMVKDLSSRYGHMRTVRGDGNCFFRSWSFCLLEYLLGISNQSDRERECNRTITLVEDNKTALGELGMDVFLIEDFFDSLGELVGGIKDGRVANVEQLRALLIDETTMLGESIITAMRFICSAHLRKDADAYAPFLDPLTVDEYCGKHVEVSNHESDQLCITAMTAEFGISMELEYVDSSRSNQHRVRFPDEGTAPPCIFMLFRPGHYDILYKK